MKIPEGDMKMTYGMDVEVVKRPQTKAGETKVNGNGQYDVKGKALLPVKTKKGVELKTQHEIKTLLNKKKVLGELNKIADEELGRKKTKTSKPKMEKNPEYARENTKARDTWIQRAVKELGVEVE